MTKVKFEDKIKKLETIINELESGNVELDENNKKYKEAKIEKVIVKDGKMTIDFVQDKLKFARIRRITGYLTGTVDRWNDAKKAELRDRVKHG